MIRVILVKILLFLGYLNAAHASANFEIPADTMVRISGVVYNTYDSSTVPATILYQKLPYYDDMGMVSSDKADGEFEMYMVKNVKYTVQVKANGFDTIEEEFVVRDDSNSGELKKHFYLKPDADHRRISLDDLRFSSGSAVITSDSYEELDDLVEWMNQRAEKMIQLEGHTDFAGNASANMRLSQDRVEAVKEYLVNKGIKKNRIRTKAFGGTQPLSQDRTPEAKAKNRRVEVRILN